jgi:hypothetical protein
MVPTELVKRSTHRVCHRVRNTGQPGRRVHGNGHARARVRLYWEMEAGALAKRPTRTPSPERHIPKPWLSALETSTAETSLYRRLPRQTGSRFKWRRPTRCKTTLTWVAVRPGRCWPGAMASAASITLQLHQPVALRRRRSSGTRPSGTEYTTTLPNSTVPPNVFQGQGRQN